MKPQKGKIQPGLAIVIAILALAFLLVNTRGCLGLPDFGMHRFDWFGAPWRFLTFSGLLQLVLGVWVADIVGLACFSEWSTFWDISFHFAIIFARRFGSVEARLMSSVRSLAML